MSTASNSFTTASSLKKKLRKAIIERNAEVCLRILKDITLSMTFGIDVSVFFTEVVMVCFSQMDPALREIDTSIGF